MDVEVTSDLPFACFGESIVANVCIDNNSGRNVNALRVKLKQIIIARKNDTKKRTIAERSYMDKMVFPIGQRSWRGKVELSLPPENPVQAASLGQLPSVPNSKLVSVTYFLSVTAR